MRKIYASFLALSLNVFTGTVFTVTAVTASTVAQADPELPTTLVDLFANPTRSDMGSFGAGVEFNSFHDSVPRFWISAEYRGAQIPGSRHTKILFAVDGRMFAIGSEAEGGGNISGADATMIPLQVARLLTDEQDEQQVAILSHRILPMAYKRDITIGIDESLSISAYGLQGESMQQFENAPRLSAFVRFAVDAVGYQLLQYYGDTQLRHGFEVANARIQIGTEIEITRGFRVTVSTGNTANVGVAFNRGQPRSIQNEFFSRLEMIFNTTFGRWNIFVQGGRRDIALLGPDSSDSRSNYIQLGVIGQF